MSVTLYEVLKNLGVSDVGKIEERLRNLEVQLAVLKWITGATGAGVILVIGMVWNVMTRLPS